MLYGTTFHPALVRLPNADTVFRHSPRSYKRLCHLPTGLPTPNVTRTVILKQRPFSDVSLMLARTTATRMHTAAPGCIAVLATVILTAVYARAIAARHLAPSSVLHAAVCSTAALLPAILST